MYSCRAAFLLILFVFLSACGDNLLPSGEDKRTPVSAGSAGGGVTQKFPDFSVTDILGAPITLSSATAGKKGAVFYFTMWCPICDSHMSDMRTSTTPLFPDVNFFLIDYISGSVAGAARAATENGYAIGVFTTLADTDHTLLNIFQATMGTTVVIDNTGIVRMNEDYRDGVNLRKTLSVLP